MCENQIVQDYLYGFTIPEIQEKYALGRRQVDRHLSENNIPLRNYSESAIMKKIRGKWAYEEVVAEVLDNYVNKKMGQLASGRPFRLSQKNIEYILNSNSITRRNFSEAAVVSAIHRSAKVNQDYFAIENQSSNMAWVLGFIAADGTVRLKNNQIKITVARRDREILERIKQELDIELDVKDYESSKGFLHSTLTWSSQKHKSDLALYHVIPQKTEKLQWPSLLEEKYWNDYIRGYFDGDGSISLAKSSNGRYYFRWRLCSATKTIITNVLDHFEKQGIPRVSIYEQHRNGKILYNIGYSTKAARSIYNILYPENAISLKRKKDEFDNAIKTSVLLDE